MTRDEFITALENDGKGMSQQRANQVADLIYGLLDILHVNNEVTIQVIQIGT